VELVEVGERLRAELLRCVGGRDAQADWAVDGILSPRAWLTHRTPVSGLEASRIVSGARLVHRHRATGKALAEGDISCAHVEVLAPIVRGREDEYADHEATLVDAASALAPDDLAQAARHWRSIVGDGQDVRRMLDRRGLHTCTPATRHPAALQPAHDKPVNARGRSSRHRSAGVMFVVERGLST
jgi:hypothetical protein